MLVLTRKLGEQIYIGDNIVVTVVEVRGDRVRLGITAPLDIPIWREEILPAVGLDPTVIIHREEVQQALFEASMAERKDGAA